MRERERERERKVSLLMLQLSLTNRSYTRVALVFTESGKGGRRTKQTMRIYFASLLIIAVFAIILRVVEGKLFQNFVGRKAGSKNILVLTLKLVERKGDCSRHLKCSRNLENSAQLQTSSLSFKQQKR
jgi:hypothetical protein